MVRYAVVFVDGQVGHSSKENYCHGIVDDSLTKKNSIQNRKLIRLYWKIFTLMSDMAATVSVAQSTQLINMISFKSRQSKISASITEQKIQRQIKQMMVPITPRKLIIPKFSKNSDFLKEYPAEKMIGGSMMVKKI